MSEDSFTNRTKVIGEILNTKFEEIENLALGNSESGIPVCFTMVFHLTSIYKRNLRSPVEQA